MTADDAPSSDERPRETEQAANAWLHDSGLVGGRGGDDAAMVRRPKSLDRSESGLVSRDYRPLQEGPRLIASWLLGPPPGGRDADAEWSVDEEWLTLQRNTLSAPQLGPLDEAPTYLVACGRARTDEDASLDLALSNVHLSGKPYDVELTITSTDETVFTTPTVECTPDRGVYRGMEARHYPEYVLRAKADGGTGYLTAGTNVQLWSG